MKRPLAEEEILAIENEDQYQPLRAAKGIIDALVFVFAITFLTVMIVITIDYIYGNRDRQLKTLSK